MNRLDLLVEVVLALVLVHRFFGSRMDVAVELAFFDLGVEYIDQLLQTLLHRNGLKQILLFLDTDPQMRRHRIRYLRRRNSSKARMQSIRISIRRNAQKLLNQRMYLLQQSVRAIARLVGRGHTSNVRIKHPIRFLLNANHPPAFAALDDDFYLTVFEPLCLQDTPQGSDLIYLLRRRFVDCRVVLSRKKYLPPARHRLLKRDHAARTPDLKGYLGKRKNNYVSDRHHGKALNIYRHLVCKFLHSLGILLQRGVTYVKVSV